MSNPKKRSRLGRGLSSLIDVDDSPAPADDPVEVRHATPIGREVTPPDPAPVTTDEPPYPPAAPIDGSIVQLDPATVDVNPHQPRRDFDEAALDELAASMKSNGLIQPVIVRVNGDRYELIAGERRLRAARRAGLNPIAAVVRDVDGYRQAQMALVENVQRQDLNPIDRAAAYRTIIDQLGLSNTELADRVGEDRSVVANHLRLLDLAPAVQEHVRAGRLTFGHAKVLAGVDDPQRQAEYAERAIREGLSVRNVERLIAVAAPPPTSTPPAKPAFRPSHLDTLERRMRQHLGAKVELPASKNGRGKIVLHYGSVDEFERLSIKLGVDPDLGEGE